MFCQGVVGWKKYFKGGTLLKMFWRMTDLHHNCPMSHFLYETYIAVFFFFSTYITFSIGAFSYVSLAAVDMPYWSVTWHKLYGICLLKCCSAAPLMVKNCFHYKFWALKFPYLRQRKVIRLCMCMNFSPWNDERPWVQPVVWRVEHRSCYVYVVSRQTHFIYIYIHSYSEYMCLSCVSP